jgi:hypothetical protein
MNDVRSDALRSFPPRNADPRTLDLVRLHASKHSGERDPVGEILGRPLEADQ